MRCSIKCVTSLAITNLTVHNLLRQCLFSFIGSCIMYIGRGETTNLYLDEPNLIEKTIGVMTLNYEVYELIRPKGILFEY